MATSLVSDLATRELEERCVDKVKLVALSEENGNLEAMVGLLEGNIRSLQGEVEICKCELAKLRDNARLAQEARNKVDHHTRCLESELDSIKHQLIEAQSSAESKKFALLLDSSPKRRSYRSFVVNSL